jgi:hypothetical protein
MALATVFNPTTKQRKQVTVGDPNAFNGGFILETPTNNLQTYKPTPPAGSVAINGAQYNTGELQKANFDNIQPIGNTLYGTPKKVTVDPVVPAAALNSATGTEITPPAPTMDQQQADMNKQANDLQINAIDPVMEYINTLNEQKATAFKDTQKYGDEYATASADRKAYQTETERQNMQTLATPQLERTANEKSTYNTYARSFDERNKLLAEQNSATRLGLSQDQYQMLLSDQQTQMQYQGQLTGQKQDILDRASALSDKQQSMMVGFVENLINNGVDINSLPASITGQAAKSFEAAGIPWDLVVAAADAVSKQQMFDNAIKSTQVSNAGSTDLPSSYQEWTLAGQPGTYADWVKTNKDSGTPTVKSINGTDLQYNPETGKWDSIATPEVPDSQKISKSKAVLDAVTAIQSTDWGKIVGSINGRKPETLLGGESYSILTKYNNLKSLLTLDNMGLMKGVLSDSDIKILTSAATPLDRRMDSPTFDKELKKIKYAATSVANSSSLSIGEIIDNGDGSYSYKNMDGTVHTGDMGDNYSDTTSPKDGTDDPLNLGFSSVGGDTNKAVTKALTTPDNQDGGQCGRFVNKYTGLGLGDSYQSKISKMDKSIKDPQPGMVFVMPYGSTGHTGFIAGVAGDYAIVKDSNYSLNEKIQTHLVPIAKMTGFTWA